MDNIAMINDGHVVGHIYKSVLLKYSEFIKLTMINVSKMDNKFITEIDIDKDIFCKRTDSDVPGNDIFKNEPYFYCNKLSINWDRVIDIINHQEFIINSKQSINLLIHELLNDIKIVAIITNYFRMQTIYDITTTYIKEYYKNILKRKTMPTYIEEYYKGRFKTKLKKECTTSQICEYIVHECEKSDIEKIIKYIPEKCITQQLCEYLIYNCGKSDIGEIAEYIPEKYITDELCEYILHECEKYDIKKIIKYIPEKCITQQLCEYLIYNCGKSDIGEIAEYIPEKYITDELCEFIIISKYLPERFIKKMDMLFKNPIIESDSDNKTETDSDELNSDDETDSGESVVLYNYNCEDNYKKYKYMDVLVKNSTFKSNVFYDDYNKTKYHKDGKIFKYIKKYYEDDKITTKCNLLTHLIQKKYSEKFKINKNNFKFKCSYLCNFDRYDNIDTLFLDETSIYIVNRNKCNEGFDDYDNEYINTNDIDNYDVDTTLIKMLEFNDNKINEQYYVRHNNGYFDCKNNIITRNSIRNDEQATCTGYDGSDYPNQYYCNSTFTIEKYTIKKIIVNTTLIS